MRSNSYADEPHRNNLMGASSYWHPYIIRNVGLQPHAVFVGDADNDGYNDIVASNSESHDISIFLWNPLKGYWSPERRIAVGTHPESLFIGDANNDGYNDIVSVNEYSNDISILLWNTSSGDWDPQINKNVADSPYSVSIGDVDNDGDNDIISTSMYGGTGNIGRISIYLWNSSSGDWDPKITRQGGWGPICAVIEDADNDGDNDIVACNFVTNQITIFLWNITLGDWETPILKPVGTHPWDVFVGDIDNDGDNDIVTANRDSHDLSIYTWNMTLGDWESQKKKSVGNYPYSVFIGDTNNDGNNDLSVASGGTGYIHLFLWNSTIKDWNPDMTLYRGNQDIFIEDANNDGIKDIIAIYTLYVDEVVIFLTKMTDRFIKMDIKEQSFSSKGFNFTFFISDETNYGLDPVNIQMWWNGNDVSSDILNLEGGNYFASLEPITVEDGEDPILLNMTISAFGYTEHYFETYISVKQCDLIDLLYFEILDQEFTEDEFILTTFLCNATKNGIDYALMQILWNNTDVSSNIENLGYGFYKLTIEPIFVKPNEAPIPLEFSIQAEGYDNLKYTIEIAVDPDIIKRKGKISENGEFPFIPVIIGSLVGAFGTGTAVFVWFRRRIRIKNKS
ncbi:MAG: FG-GAP repeat domain-containing protein [Candidatus Hermodarchaeota archaeon]